MDRHRLTFYTNVAHPTLAVTLPLVFVLLMDHLLRALFVDQVVGPNPPGFVLVVIVTGIAEASVASALGRARSRQFLLRLRELLVILLVAYLVFQLTTGALLQGEFVPGRETLYSLQLVLVQWILTVTLHVTLQQRETFLQLIVGHEGDQLSQALREHFTEATASAARMNRTKRFVLTFQALPLGLFLIALLNGSDTGGALFPLALGYLGLGACVLAVIDGYAEEQLYFGAGLTLGADLRRRRIGTAILLVALAMLVAWPLVGASSPLPSDTIDRLMSWLRGTLTWEPLLARPPELPTTQEARLVPQRDSSADVLSLGQQEGGFAGLMSALLRWVGVGLAAVAALFLIRPLFTKDLRDRLRSVRVGSVVRGIVRALTQLLISLLTIARRIGQAPGVVGKRIAKTVSARVEKQRQVAQQRHQREVEAARWRQHADAIKSFVRLIRAGERLGVRFRPSFGPLQYAGLLGQRVPLHGEAVRDVATSFERLVFSGKPAEPDQNRDFDQKLRAALAALRTAAPQR